jgi:PadR family transcriptional regulator, regulatory protein PadR
LWYRNSVSEWLAQARRGLIELCVLALISKTPHYGYELATALGTWGKTLAASEGTLYPLLRRLQREGLVEATWQESPDGPPRKYYHLSDAGARLLQSQLVEWDQLTQAIAHLRADGININTVDKEVPDGSGSERQPALSRRPSTSARPPAGA